MVIENLCLMIDNYHFEYYVLNQRKNLRKIHYLIVIFRIHTLKNNAHKRSNRMFLSFVFTL